MCVTQVAIRHLLSFAHPQTSEMARDPEIDVYLLPTKKKWSSLRRVDEFDVRDHAMMALYASSTAHIW